MWQWENQLDMFNFSALTIFTFVDVRDLIEFSHFFDSDNSRRLIRHTCIISIVKKCAMRLTTARKKRISRKKKKDMNKKKQLHEKQIYTQFLSTFKWNIKKVSQKQHAMYVNTFTFDEASDFILYSWWKKCSRKIRMSLSWRIKLENHLSRSRQHLFKCKYKMSTCNMKINTKM